MMLKKNQRELTAAELNDFNESIKAIDSQSTETEKDMLADIDSYFEELKDAFEKHNPQDRSLLIEMEKSRIKSTLFSSLPNDEPRNKQQWICQYVANYIAKGLTGHFKRADYIIKGSFKSMQRDWAVEAHAKYQFLKWMETEFSASSLKRQRLTKAAIGRLLHLQTEVPPSQITESFLNPIAQLLGWKGKRPGHDLHKAYRNACDDKTGVSDQSITEFLTNPDKAITKLKRAFESKQDR